MVWLKGEAQTKPGLPQIFKTESFATIANGFESLTIVPKLFTLDVCGGTSYAFERGGSIKC